ncbi:hypothetical protein FIBSPDRAFT_1046273 [Athelia psychrophila]|uniref:DUF6533 domain-containing protein n=1 Tax=Athelia psychrophila TaxID=1759441 RepID=A0A166H2B7_9AGAM|nr:hypothetical protein FIBSPDRAFT_1046273 [Fibularhizoctonia sp. CBS 109695]
MSDSALIGKLLQTQTATYLTLGTLTAATWDWTLALAEEYRIVKRCGLSFAILAYFLARTSAVMLCVLTLIFYTGVPPGENSCSAVFGGIGGMIVIGNASKGYLFLLRVRAVYGKSLLVTLCVGVGWLLMVGSRLTVALLVHTTPLGQTGYCAVTVIGSLPTISLWLNFAYDTCIFISISVRLASYTTTTAAPWILTFVRGYGLPPTMRRLLQEGQLYYLYVPVFVTVLPIFEGNVFSTNLVAIFSAAIIAVSPVGPIYQAIFTVPATVTETIMTCKVFRAMVLRSFEVHDQNITSRDLRHLNRRPSSSLDDSLTYRRLGHLTH